MKTHSLLATLLAATLLLVTACGQKGPLFLPEDETGATQTENADQSQEKEDGEDAGSSTE